MHKLKIEYLGQAGDLYGDGLAYATSASAGLDLRACFAEPSIKIAPGERAKVPTGIKVEPDSDQVAGFVYSRSGLGAVKGLTVAQGVGVIDPDYRGEIIVFLLNTASETLSVERGERIAQLIYQPVFRPEIEAVDRVGDTGRGQGGFGHSGKV